MHTTHISQVMMAAIKLLNLPAGTIGSVTLK
jgi:hypothetical protein